MELGFSVAAGLLSQISIPLFSIELAVQLASGTYGWWKAGDRARSLSSLVDAKGAKISAASTFALLRHIDKRKGGLIRGIARTPSGFFSCVTLSNASTASSSGDAGFICLRAVVCALLCFYSVSTTVDILAAALPGTLYTTDQTDGNDSIEGALLSSLRDYVKAAAIEEDNDELRQNLQAEVDSKLPNITGATSADVFESDNHLESDAPNFIGALRWILTPVVKRDPRVYPTRSLKVWALAEIMSQLGFEVAASMKAVSSKEDYEIYVEKVGYQAGYQEVILVTSNHGPTDPFAYGGGSIQAFSKPRIGSIRSIPWIAFRHLKDSKSHATTKYLSEVWEFTFNHVYNQLEPAEKISNSEYGNSGCVDFIKTIRENIHQTSPKSLPQNSNLSNSMQWLTFAIFEPLKKFSPPGSAIDNDSIWSKTNTVGQIRGLNADYLDPPHGDGADDWYITRTAVLAAVYALCCRWLYIDDPAADMLDTEVAFCPDFIRRGNLARWTSFPCFDSKIHPKNIPSSFDAQWRFCAEMSHKSWLHLLYMVFSGTSKDTKMAPRIAYTGSSGISTTRTILGFQENGIALIPHLLADPSADAANWFKYQLHVGQLLDLPLDDDGFVCHAAKPVNITSSEIWEYGSGGITTQVENLPSDTVIRLDVEPWWELDERTVVFRARVGGIVKAIFSPDAIYTKSHIVSESSCQCPVPKKDSIELKEPVVVLRVSDILANYHKKMVYNVASPYEIRPVFVQTGGNRMSQTVCLALLPYSTSWGAQGCLDSFREHSLSRFNVL